MLRYNEMKL